MNLQLDHLLKCLKRVIDILNSNFIHLYPNLNNTKLIKVISQYCNVPHNQIQYFSGSDSLHEYIIRCFLCLGDKVLIIGPTYDNFRLNAESAGSHIHIANCDHYFKYDNERILSKIKKIKPKNGLFM